MPMHSNIRLEYAFQSRITPMQNVPWNITWSLCTCIDATPTMTWWKPLETDSLLLTYICWTITKSTIEKTKHSHKDKKHTALKSQLASFWFHSPNNKITLPTLLTACTCRTTTETNILPLQLSACSLHAEKSCAALTQCAWIFPRINTEGLPPLQRG